MTIVDLAKARAYASSIGRSDEATVAALWIEDLVDEVESLQRVVPSVRASEQAALADAARLQEERDAALSALVDILRTINTILPRV